ncbi:MAG: GNAT family N-acetyltransferase [Prolixibacteraceae bacterium]
MIIGYLNLNFDQAQTALINTKALEIERIYVLKEFQGKKVGQILFDTTLQTANRLKSEYIWLGVWEKNFRALTFYEKICFTEFGQHIFILGDDVQTDIMMKLNL